MDWHQRFLQQAQWTEPVRRYLLGEASLPHGARILDVGCGTGALLPFLRGYAQGGAFGLDRDFDFLRKAASGSPGSPLALADALRMPFPPAAFDAAVCHFFLLWAADPLRALAEMARVVKPGGVLIAFAEPYYRGRIDYPPPLDRLGRLQAESLRRQGADPDLGVRLAGLFVKTGLRKVVFGTLGGQWRSPDDAAVESERETVESDLREMVSEAELAEFLESDRQARESGERVLYVPTFYAIGWKNDSG